MVKTKAKATKKCSRPRCTNDAVSIRAKFCTACFKKNASLTSSKRKVFGGGGGVFGNSGNTTTARGKGVLGNGGNTIAGRQKKSAGARSGLKRSAKFALVVKKHWLDKILAGEKTWEIRGSSTSRRGWIHLAQSKAGGTLVGRARLVKCIQLDKTAFFEHVHLHCVPRLSMVPYKRVFAWVLEDVERFVQPFTYNHRQGAVIWATAWGNHG